MACYDNISDRWMLGFVSYRCFSVEHNSIGYSGPISTDKSSSGSQVLETVAKNSDLGRDNPRQQYYNTLLWGYLSSPS